MSMDRDELLAQRMAAKERGGLFTHGSLEGQFNKLTFDTKKRAGVVPLNFWFYFRPVRGEYKVQEWPNPHGPVEIILPWYEFPMHFVAEGPGRPAYVGTCGRYFNRFAPLEQCHVCNYVDSRDPAPTYAFNIWALNYFHTIKKPNAGNKDLMHDEVRICQATAQNRNCKWCVENPAAVESRMLGFKSHMSFSLAEFHTLWKLHTQLGSKCKCGGQIIVCRALCPECQTVLVDIDKSGYSDADFQRYLAEDQFCPTCRKKITPTKEKRCSNCAQPKPFGMWDAVLKGRRVPVNRGGRDFTELELQIAKVTPPDPKFGEFKPYDLPAIYAPDSVSKLCKRIPGLRQKINQERFSDPGGVPRTGLTSAGRADVDAAVGALVPRTIPSGSALPPGLEDMESPTPGHPEFEDALRTKAPGTSLPVGRGGEEEDPPAEEFPPELDLDL